MLGLSAGMAPAGLMWSVVTDSPHLTSTFAPWIAAMGEASADMSMKKGGSWM